MAADRPPQNVGSLRLPITKRQRRDRLDLWITWVEDRNHRGEAFTLPDWGRHELVVLGVAIPDPLTGASLHEALMDAQADALDTLPWPPPEDAGEKWHSPCPDCGVDWRSAFRFVESRRCKACNLGRRNPSLPISSSGPAGAANTAGPTPFLVETAAEPRIGAAG